MYIEFIYRLDSVLRGAARLILKRQRSDHISDSMREQLHWLDIRSRIEFKMSLLAFRCLNDSAPRYLSHRVHSRCWSNWTIAFSLRCFRGYSCASMPDVDNRSSGFHSCLPQGLELSPEAPPQTGHQPACFQEGTQD